MLKVVTYGNRGANKRRNAVRLMGMKWADGWNKAPRMPRWGSAFRSIIWKRAPDTALR
jgi:hypothetical protein